MVFQSEEPPYNEALQCFVVGIGAQILIESYSKPGTSSKSPPRRVHPTCWAPNQSPTLGLGRLPTMKQMFKKNNFGIQKVSHTLQMYNSKIDSMTLRQTALTNSVCHRKPCLSLLVSFSRINWGFGNTSQPKLQPEMEAGAFLAYWAYRSIVLLLCPEPRGGHYKSGHNAKDVQWKRSPTNDGSTQGSGCTLLYLMAILLRTAHRHGSKTKTQ